MAVNDLTKIEPWLTEIEWELNYSDHSASEVISTMIRLGFTIMTPPMPPYAVTYNGVPIYRCYMREEAESFITKLGSKPGYGIKEINDNER